MYVAAFRRPAAAFVRAAEQTLAPGQGDSGRALGLGGGNGEGHLLVDRVAVASVASALEDLSDAFDVGCDA